MAMKSSESITLAGGDLTLYGVGETWKKIRSFLSNGTLRCLDISEVTECDTAGVQLLLVSISALNESGSRGAVQGSSRAVTEALERCGFPGAVLTGTAV
ncbi:MAG TPA: STAS domain-containing protein [Spirochaetota bacterium]|nr:STAS domain-containing protein [Spirochaetota bacterium]HPN81951.1 STAS domain-containing protein [Spirochaetota bacterium]